MRIACRTSLNPAELTQIVTTLVDRLKEAGATRFPGFNLYVNPWAGGSEMELRNERDEAVDIFAVDDPSPDQLIPANSMYRLVLSTDYHLRRTFLAFSALAEIPDEVILAILGGTVAFRWQQLMAPVIPELTKTERYGMQAVATVAHRLAQICGDRHEVEKWLHGPFPAYGLVGDTPADQLRIGGLGAVEYMGDMLEVYIRDFWRDGLQVNPPPRGFGKSGGTSGSSVPLAENNRGAVNTTLRDSRRRPGINQAED